MPYVLALDQGTTSSRALVFDASGRVRGLAQEEVTQHYPAPGWVEHDPREIWQTQSSVAARALSLAGLVARDVVALGITNQRETTIVWDRRSGEPIHPAIVWQDRRTAETCDRLRADGVEALVRAKTGLVLDPYFSATKIGWILDRVDGARARAEAGELAFGTIDSWLLHCLTGGRVHATDPSNASRTLLFDLHAGAWDDELLQLFRVPRSLLPEVRPSSGVFAEAAVPGLAGIPVAGVAGDQQAALFGEACFSPGRAKNTYGTGSFVLQNAGRASPAASSRLLGTVAWHVDGASTYALEGSVFTGGAVVQWLRDGLGLIERAEDVEALARQVEDTEDVFLVPAFTGLGAPHWDPYARGALVGLTRGTTSAHVARAALESIALQVADVLDAMQEDSGLTLPELRVDGGAARNDLLLQMQADLLGRPVLRAEILEVTALGAAWLAGLAVGAWSDLDALDAAWRADRVFEPLLSADAAATRRARWAQALERAGGWARAE